MGKPERRKPLGILKCTWEDNIKVYFKDVKDDGVWARFMWLRIVTSGGIL
jgi:hypothetical protein